MANPSPTLKQDSATPVAISSTVSRMGEVTGTSDKANNEKLHLETLLSPSQAADELGRLERYRVLKVLGMGGMGAVLLTEDIHLKRLAAVKIMLPNFAQSAEARERFLRRARAAARIKHDHIISIYQVDEANGIPFIAMEYLKGVPLDRHLQEQGEVTLEQAIDIARQTAEGLQAAHAEGLVHRDIKPGNLWLEAPKARVKILDFGLARQQTEEVHLTQSGTILGTPAYMSPEQACSQVVDARADLWSLGVLLYRLCTGQLPFQADNVMGMLAALAFNEPAPVRELNAKVPESLAAVIHRLLAKHPEERFATAQEVADALSEILSSCRQASAFNSPTVPTLPSATTIESNKRQAFPLKWLAAAVILLGGGVVGAVFVFQKPTVRQEKPVEPKTSVADNQKTDVEEKAKLEGVDKPQKKELAKIGLEEKVKSEGEDKLQKKEPPIDPPPKKELKKEPVARDDRTAVEWVLAQGGMVQVGEQVDWLTASAMLPAGAVQLTGVDLSGQSVTEDGLANLKDCKRLTQLNLSNSNVTNDGLKAFRDCTTLTSLNLSDTSVTDAGLEPFKDCKHLTSLDLIYTKATDGALVHFKDCKDLTFLALSYTKVTDDGLAHFKGCQKVRILRLSRTKLTDTGLAFFKDCGELSELLLYGTAVGDESVPILSALTKLQVLDLKKTRMTTAEIETLRKALPDCKLMWDGEMSEPKK